MNEPQNLWMNAIPELPGNIHHFNYFVSCFKLNEKYYLSFSDNIPKKEIEQQNKQSK